jgi:glycosyltransferase involved in cell wall biosynthesis
MRGIQARGLQVIAMGGDGDGFESKLRECGVIFGLLPIDKRGLNPLADLRLLWELFRRMRRRQPALVHLFTIKPVIYGGIAARLTGIPVVATVTGLGHAFTSGNVFLRRLVEFLYRVALKRAKIVFFQNSDDKELFIGRGLVRPEQARLTPGSGVDIQRFGFVESQAPASAPVFLMVARLIREKGVVEYLKAAGRLRQEHPHIRCLLVGAPDQRNPSALSASEIEQLVKVTGVEWQGATDDVRPWLSQADVVILPSYREGVPRSLLEAAAMGRALIATDAIGCREVVDPEVNGLLVPVRDVGALVSAMKRFVENPELIARFGAEGRKKVMREFDERHVIDLTLEAYRQVGIYMEVEHETVDLS